MKRLIRVVLLAACAAALAASPAAAGVSSRAEVVPGPSADVAPPPAEEVREYERFNTGGEWLTPPTEGGSASGWAFYILHDFRPHAGFQLVFYEFGFPTNAYSADPIELPVEWVADKQAHDIYAIANPYSYPWTWRGTFYPTGAPDTRPPDTYTLVDLGPQFVFISPGEHLIWGYENAGLCGMIAYNGVETIGWYVSYWDSDVPYGRTSLMQFRASNCTPAAERSLSAIKSLY